MSFSVAFVLFPGVTQLDLTGPAQVLSRLPGGSMSYLSTSMQSVETDCGFAIVPTAILADTQSVDLVCVPGGFGVVDALADPDFVAQIRRLADSAQYVTSVCTGALLLGAAGHLHGKRATTHWAYHELLHLVGAHPVHERVVRDGNVFTGGGVTAGIDFALTVAAEVAGESVARAIATGIEYDPAPPFGRGIPDSQPDDVAEALFARYRTPVAQTRVALVESLSGRDAAIR